jgi:uncharacterized membrane protein
MWTAGDVVSSAWEAFKPQWTILVASYVLVSFVTQVAQVPGLVFSGFVAVAHVPPQSVDATMPRLVQMAISLPLMLAVSTFFHIGLMRLWLQVARGERPQFEVIFSGLDRFLPYVGATLLMGVAIFFGLLLFIVPGVLLALGWSMVPYYVIDSNLGPVEALGASWRATKGRWGTLMLLGFASFGITLAGLACCCIGMLAAAPLSMLLYATFYTRVSGRGAPAPLGTDLY